MVRFACVVAAAIQTSVLAETLIRRQVAVEVTPEGPIVDRAQPEHVRASYLRPDDEHVLPTAISVTADGQTSMLQGLYSGIDAEGDAEPPPDDTDPDVENTLPEAFWKSGAQLVNTTYGPLVAELLNAMVKIQIYHSKTIYKAGTNKSANPVKAELVGIMAKWKDELRKHSARFGTCSDEVVEMESCIALSLCLIEPEVGKSVAQHTFTLIVEVETEIRHIMMRDFEIYFNEFAQNASHPCAIQGQPPALVEGTSEQLSQAVAVVAKVHRAASRTVDMLTHSNTSLLVELESASIADIWTDVCTGLGCEPQSWMDVMDAMHGHSAELVKLGAPTRAIGTHISSMRSAHRAVQRASHLRQIQGLLTEMPLARAANTSAYDRQIKEAAGTVYAAVEILRRSGAADTDGLKWWWSCFGIGISVSNGYQFSFPPPPASWGVSGGIAIGRGFSADVGKLTDTLDGKAACWGSSGVSVTVGATAGFIPNFKGFGACVGAGFQFSARVSSCGITMSVSATAGGSISAPSTGCTLGPSLGAFECASSIGIGLTVYCCTASLPSGDYECGR